VGALALALWLLPLRLSVPVLDAPAAPPLVATQAMTAQPADGDGYQDVVRLNVFSPSREPPAEQAAATPTTAAPERRAPRLRLRLSGIVRGEGGAVALIDHDPSLPGAELVRTGDRVGAYVLVEIGDSFVTLRGPSGTLTLRLDPITGGTS
jgi:hypothetical protein